LSSKFRNVVFATFIRGVVRESDVSRVELEGNDARALAGPLWSSCIRAPPNSPPPHFPRALIVVDESFANNNFIGNDFAFVFVLN
jgi:hypothetical protein